MAEAESRKAWRSVGAFIGLIAALTTLSTILELHVEMPWRVAYTIDMWMPALAAVIALRFRKEGIRTLGFHALHWNSMFWAVGLPVLYALPVYLSVWIGGVGAFEPARWGRVVPLIGDPGSSGKALAVLLTVGLADKFSRALGEEIGWRGFLFPELRKIYSFLPAALISGFIWFLWHLPAILLEDYHSGAQVSIAYQISCFGLALIPISVLYAWLRERSGSVWPCALLHAAHNLFVQSIFDQATVETKYTPYVTGEFGAGLVITGWIAFAILLISMRGRLTPASGERFAP